MKKLIATLALALLVTGARAEAAVQMLINTSTLQTTLACGASDPNDDGAWGATGTSMVYPISGLDTIVVHPYSTSTSDATWVIETGPSTTGPWGVVATGTNPTSTEIGWSIPRDNFLRFRVSVYASGKIRACLSGWLGQVQKY